MALPKPMVGVPLTATGGVAAGPTGSTLPTDATTVLPAGIEALGLVGDEGVSLTRERSTDDIRAWGGQIVRTVLLPEARPGLIAAATVTLIALISYSAMAGAIGGGGLGDFAIRYGYQRFDTAVTIACVVVLLVMVQLLQEAGDRLARRLAHR